ncbi:FliI/YscN family ATPase [Marinibacterium profundimaris]|uniref:ATP synthase n=1 Tax=Marinibacterium profundimaris TaxID=1679460 RepID=A0A225NNB1_9RHOB|nr:FliI/YscN family ATPase [Marinibacterium profundimaris]OWU75862.1 ATP synthase [Marinibacterium profundimaris]
MMEMQKLATRIGRARACFPLGHVTGVQGGLVDVAGLSETAGIGDHLRISRRGGTALAAEVVGLCKDSVRALPDGPSTHVAVGDSVRLSAPPDFAPDACWIGRVVDPMGRPVDGMPLVRGLHSRDIHAGPPAAAARRGLGARLNTGQCVFNTLLPIVRGQRIGLFAGSGVGKSQLMASFARQLEADVVVIALIGERGREVGHFVRDVLGPQGMARSVVVAASSDQSPLMRRRCALSAMAVAEHFRDEGKQVLLLADSVTRFAEAHREIAVAAGEPPALRGYPPSTAAMIGGLCERAGTGMNAQGDITAVFSVLVAGSDMEEPVADMLRGVLDGHVVLSRAIAERGRYPAIDLLQSVSRSLPDAANPQENERIGEARRLLGAYQQAEVMIQSGLYASGSDPLLDQAVRAWPELDGFLARAEAGDIASSFDRLNLILRRSGSGSGR